MNREIKFKGWNSIVCRMSDPMTLREIYETKAVQWHIIDWLQYTGLKDKNGVEIYEGDIVEAWSSGSKVIFMIKWRQEGSPCWLLYPNFQNRDHWSISATKYKKGKQFITVECKVTEPDKEGFYDDGLSVIGNIHENPELLNK